MCFITFTFYEYSNVIFVLFFTRIPFYSHLKRKNFSKKKKPQIRQDENQIRWRKTYRIFLN